MKKTQINKIKRRKKQEQKPLHTFFLTENSVKFQQLDLTLVHYFISMWVDFGYFFSPNEFSFALDAMKFLWGVFRGNDSTTK